MRSLTSLIICAAFATGLSSMAMAKGGTPQNHHCMKDGAELTGKTRKECKKEGGTWDKTAGPAKTDAPAKAP